MQITQEKIAQWIREGCGQGHGSEYTPWIRISRRGSPSGGHLEFEYVPQLNRHFHLLSKNELQITVLLLWLGIADLREQFPCWPWAHPHPLYMHPYFNPQHVIWSEGTIAITKRIGIKHPYYPGTRIYYIPTIDLMVTLVREKKARIVAFAVKPEGKDVPLDNYELEKLAITSEYCSDLLIPWKLVSGSLIPATLASNLCTLFPYSGELNCDIANKWPRFIDALNCNLSPNISIEEALNVVEREASLTRTSTLNLFHRALWHRKTNIDLRHAIVMSAPPVMSDQSWVQATSNYMFG